MLDERLFNADFLDSGNDDDQKDNEQEDMKEKDADDLINWQVIAIIIIEGDKKLKDAAVKHALDILGNATVHEKTEDDVAASFTKELCAYVADLEAKPGQVG
ncbi:hypothetical protein PHYBOEH_002482 [Phytophthora boehmeriae]|uniref:Uncharacterized protein n=1 Tax=Phytophthora boehmeriae TaxID=109152 RepID=A0A8T1V7D6_9STRA|nr:hypothetical protein PHYBOEH_002482 [Phytophthora boehmeriae]